MKRCAGVGRFYNVSIGFFENELRLLDLHVYLSPNIVFYKIK